LPHWETDLLTSLAGLEFETCFAQANISDIGDGTVRVLSRSDIIVTKATSDRQLDQDDVVALNAGIDHG
jgi:hypothetical protein